MSSGEHAQRGRQLERGISDQKKQTKKAKKQACAAAMAASQHGKHTEKVKKSKTVAERVEIVKAS